MTATVTHVDECVDDRIDALFTDVALRPVAQPRRRVFGTILPGAALATLAGLHLVAARASALSVVPEIWVVLAFACIIGGAASLASIRCRPRDAVRIAAVASAVILVAGWAGLIPHAQDLATIVVLVVAGIVASRSIARVSWLLPIVVAISWSDVDSFLNGTTRTLVDGLGTSAPGAAAVGASAQSGGLPFVVLPVPHELWVVGCVDVFFIAALIGTAANHRLGLVRTAAALLGGVALAVAVGPPVPLLPFLAVAFAAVHVTTIVSGVRYGVLRAVRPIG